MYRLINFVNIFQIIYEGFKCKLKFFQCAFMNKTFCMQKNKLKPSSVSAFFIMSEKNKCRIY